jgi:DNA polymerase type B, organellar and viral
MLKHSENSGTSSSLITDFVTMDIETIVKNNQLIPYLISAFNGTDYIESFGNNQQELFSNFIKGLLTFFNDKNKTLTVYAHNFSKFDGLFILKHLLPFGIVDPLLFNGKLITIKLKLNIEGCEHNGKTIIFKDSFLLLPSSLRSLALIYNLTEIKGIFPFKLNDIFYNGVFPRFEYFNDLTIDKYLSISQEFKNKLWNFKDEAIKYCKLDCQILFEILTKFNELVFNEFKINIHKALTLPALAMKLFKSNNMPKNTVYQLHGLVEKNIRLSYTGGAVDVYT